MSSIATAAVFKATIGLLVEKGRDELAVRLRDGDVTNQEFHSLIVREIDDIESKLDASSKEDLEASISVFKKGMGYLYEVLGKANSTSECGAATAHATCDGAFSFNQGISRLELTDLDGSARTKLSTAKKTFRDAKEEATKAFQNRGLKTSDRILAMKYQVMATILGRIDHPADAVASCRKCIEELNCLPAVQNAFVVKLKNGFQAVKGLFGKEERRKIISRVCHVNCVIYDVTRSVGEDASSLSWPLVDVGKIKINPVHDVRATKVLLKQGVKHWCATPWSLGRRGENPWGITTNSSGELIVGEKEDHCVKAFDSSGKFVKNFSLPNDDVNTNLYTCDLATDRNDNVFVLIRMEKPGTENSWWVYTLTKAADLSNTFRLSGERCEYRGLSVSVSGKVLTLRDSRAVEIYDTNGKFVHSFGESILKDAWDVTVATDGRVMVVDKKGSWVHIFSEHGENLKKFKLQKNDCAYGSITFHRIGEHVVVAGARPEKKLLQVEIYSKDGEFVYSVKIQIDGIHEVGWMTVTTKGRIAVVVRILESLKVFVL